jgi:hypothetical protein
MGQQMVIYLIAHPREVEPDWAAAGTALRQLDLDGQELAGLDADLRALRDAVTVGSRDLAVLELDDMRVYATGGPTWGDTPTDLAEVIERLAAHVEIYDAANLALVT